MSTTTASTKPAETPVRLECGKCSGTGSVSWGMTVSGVVRYTDGRQVEVPKVCFDCGGVGYRMSTVEREARNAKRREADARRRQAKAQAKADAERAEREATLEANRAAYVAEHADVVAALPSLPGEFGESLREAFAETGRLTERQGEAALRVAAEVAEKAARPVVAVPAGRQIVTGTVRSAKWVENGFGGALKILVEDDRGFRVYGSAASALQGFGLDRGARVTFTATLEPKDGEEGFGFYSRPTKAALLEAAPEA